MTISLSSLRSRLTPSLPTGALIRLLEPLATRQFKIYLGLVTLFALLGYLLLLLFPLIAISFAADLPQEIRQAHNWQLWLNIGINVLIILAALALSVPLVLTRFTPPQGLELGPDKAPRLFQLIDDLREEFKRPRVDRVVLQEGFRIDAIKTPRWGLPVWHDHTLVIGLDALLTLPPEHFKSLLARRVGQFSGLHNRYTGWLNFLCQTWPQYHEAFKRQKLPLVWPLQLMFALYAPLYTALAFYATRQDELEADRYALDITNDQDLAVFFSQLVITESFLNSKYWPKLRQLAQRNQGKSPHPPYASILSVFRRGLTKEDMQNWIKTEFERHSDTRDSRPLLRQRLENIGHHKPKSPLPLKTTAAEELFDARILGKIIEKFDQLWKPGP